MFKWRGLVVVIGIAIWAMGIQTVLGYAMDHVGWTQWGPNGPPMALNTAFAFTLTGAAIIIVGWRVLNGHNE